MNEFDIPPMRRREDGIAERYGVEAVFCHVERGAFVEYDDGEITVVRGGPESGFPRDKAELDDGEEPEQAVQDVLKALNDDYFGSGLND